MQALIPDIQASSVLWASFQDISYPLPIIVCVVEIRRECTKPNVPSAVSCFPFFSVTIPSGFGDLSSKIDFNSLGIKHLVLTLPSSCQSQSELNVVSKDFSIIPSKWLDGVLCYLNLREPSKCKEITKHHNIWFCLYRSTPPRCCMLPPLQEGKKNWCLV